MENQRDAWESFYATNRRPWRGVTMIEHLPFPEGSHILEIGCGNGKTAVFLRGQGYKVTAMDFSQSAIDMCQSSMDKDIEFVCGDALCMPFADGSFDGAVSYHVIEHLTADEMKTAVSEIKRVLKKGSHLLIKVFSKGDMRSNKGERIDDSTVVRGNGILYHYFTEEELCQIFSEFECVDICTVEERTHFGEMRSRIEADFLL